MGSKNKLKRFQDNEVFANVIQPLRSEIVEEEFQFKGKWKRDFFKNDKPLILELGCGKGEYTLGLAERNKDCNYLGIDIKGARFWRGAKTALENEMPNVGFLRTQIELVDQVFAEGEVDEIWITFPDPQIKWKRTKHRMTNPEFLNKYKHILTKEGIIHLKTDSEFMHGYTLGILEGLGHDILYAHHNIYVNHEAPEEVVGIQTFYEQQYLDKNKSITYLKFRLKP
ncbi:tRNA (guanosine(46)-N7)-methyltransferase TrmB [Psychroflexus gondwanensis]|uniref:tRNA (guanine-N(7)-)-methyltransferase n=1 Tax=Psychroflexus gondwanensis ACAM 44 TaxID=1189619 RepID=N1WYV9_9FLAO|nr:tRNA (guanosine(46)-N7)-methyltransferase TrmB [Psychroflexus gondwanensis]EMY81053.1 tRNA (guanine-N(7)-)-methyltransferase [Psychroflexus gondwanensis ACAM 44]TXE17751.1 tRNA (guanosine(46)-N7)-methyltransferase TrmB [Psychroflexus gondwanensis]